MVSKIDMMTSDEEEIEIVDETSSSEEEDVEIEIEDETSSEEEEDVEIVDETSSSEEEEEAKEIEEDEIYIDDTTTTSTSSVLSESLKGDQVSVLKNERLGKLQLSHDEKIPLKFIRKIEGVFVNILNLLDPSKNIIENSNILSSNNIKLRDNYDMLYLFYFLNRDKDNEYLVENFNIFVEKLGMKKYYLENFDSDIEKIETQYNFLMERTNIELKKYKEFYAKIENFKNTDSYDSIIDSISISNTEAEYYIKDGQYDFDKDNIKIIFNKLKATNFFTYIRMDLPAKNQLYKIHIESNKKIENFIEVNNSVEHQDYKIYLFYE